MREIIEKYDAFVKDLIAHQERQASRYATRDDGKRALSYQSRATMLREMWQAIINAAQGAKIAPDDIDEVSLRLTPADLQDLPPELIQELSISESDRKDFMVLDIIDSLGGVTSLDKILVTIYHRTNEIEKRTRLNARLYRMQQKGMVFSAPDRKGVYSTKPFLNSKDGASSEPSTGDDDAQPNLDFV
ncbi:hypothetical protein [Bordetella avium]